MATRIQFVIRLEKKQNWLHDQHSWSVPLLSIPGVKLTHVLNEDERIERSAYDVDYKKQQLRGPGVQHLDTLHIQLHFTSRLSAWSNVVLTGFTGFAGMLILFLITLMPPPGERSMAPEKYDSVMDQNSLTESLGSSDMSMPDGKPSQTRTPVQVSYIVNTTAVNDAVQRDVIVAIGEIPDSTGSKEILSPDAAGELDIADVLRQNECRVYTSFFDPAIYANGIFQQLMGKNFSKVTLNELHNSADELCIGTIQRRTRPAISLKNMFSAEIEVHIRFLSLETGQEMRRIDKTITKPGFTSSQALTLANEELKEFLNHTL